MVRLRDFAAGSWELEAGPDYTELMTDDELIRGV